MYTVNAFCAQLKRASRTTSKAKAHPPAAAVATVVGELSQAALQAAYLGHISHCHPPARQLPTLLCATLLRQIVITIYGPAPLLGLLSPPSLRPSPSANACSPHQLAQSSCGGNEQCPAAHVCCECLACGAPFAVPPMPGLLEPGSGPCSC